MYIKTRQIKPTNAHSTILSQTPLLFSGSIAYNIAYSKGEPVDLSDPQLVVR